MGKAVPERIVRWCAAFLHEKEARVRWGSTESEWREMREGTAQGTNSAPTLFDVLVDDLQGVDTQCADDAVALVQAATEEVCVAEYATNMRELWGWRNGGSRSTWANATTPCSRKQRKAGGRKR